MTPERKAYLMKCSGKEDFIRAKISYYKQQLKSLKMTKLTIGCMLRHLRGQIKRTKWHLNAYRHELARLKGMDKVAMPFHSYHRGFEDGHLVEYEIWTCPKCDVLVGGDCLETYNFCPDCGRRILWEKVK